MDPEDLLQRQHDRSLSNLAQKEAEETDAAQFGVQRGNTEESGGHRNSQGSDSTTQSEPERCVEQQAQSEVIAQQILSGTWSGGQKTETSPETVRNLLEQARLKLPVPSHLLCNGDAGDLPTPLPAQRHTFDRGLVSGDVGRPCDACGQEFHSGDRAYEQRYPFLGKRERLCSSCFEEREAQANGDPNLARTRSWATEGSSDELLTPMEIKPLHADPALDWLASQGGSMSGIRQHIQDEMQRLLGAPEPQETSNPSPEQGLVAQPPLTPVQMVVP